MKASTKWLLGLLILGCGAPAPDLCKTGDETGSCNNPGAGQCVDFTHLSTADLASEQQICAQVRGHWQTTLCDQTGEVGSCQIPPGDANTGVNCSPSATITERYASGSYTTTSAQNACAGAPGTTFHAG